MDLRFAKLRALLKSDPYGLVCRLYDHAAALQQDGDISLVDDDVLAQRLEFRGTGSRLRRLLTKAGYLDQNGCIVGWDQDIFRLFDSVRKQNRDRALKSVAVRAQAREYLASKAVGQEKTEQKNKGDERIATVQPAEERPVGPVAARPLLNTWPLNLSPDQIADICFDTKKSADFVTAKWREYRARKIWYKDDFANDYALTDFKNTVRKAKKPPLVGPPRESLAEPPNWRTILERLYLGNGINERNEPWSSLPLEKQREVLAASKPAAAPVLSASENLPEIQN